LSQVRLGRNLAAKAAARNQISVDDYCSFGTPAVLPVQSRYQLNCPPLSRCTEIPAFELAGHIMRLNPGQEPLILTTNGGSDFLCLIHLNTSDYSSPAPSEGSSAASIFESRFMLVA
jgi:hypothetical protein